MAAIAVCGLCLKKKLKYVCFNYFFKNTSRPLTRRGSQAENKASHGRNSVSFQMFVILLSLITLGPEF